MASLSENEKAKKKIIDIKRKKAQDRINGKVKPALEIDDWGLYLALRADKQSGRLFDRSKIAKFEELESHFKSIGKIK